MHRHVNTRDYSSAEQMDCFWAAMATQDVIANGREWEPVGWNWEWKRQLPCEGVRRWWRGRKTVTLLHGWSKRLMMEKETVDDGGITASSVGTDSLLADFVKLFHTSKS